MADAAVTFLLEQVTAVIKDYASLISGAEKEFTKLKEDVEELKTILKDTANKSAENNGARLIKNRIREVVYDVENEIDSWLTESKNRKAGQIFANINFAKKVKSLREDKVQYMLDKANKMKADLQSAGTSKEEEAHEWRTDHTIRKEKVVSLKDEEDKIKGYLMTCQSGLDIIPIIGMPGLGKTTLTWKIFNNEKIRHEFPIRIWVHFSQRFNSRGVLIQIMEYFTADKAELHSMDIEELCRKVHACLSRDKFLLVMDDVWKEGHWDDIKNALPYSNANGKIIITSRELTVGRHVKCFTPPHEQRPLKETESWELLQLEVFGKIGDCPDELQDIGDTIAKRCKGIPLTIVVIGGVLKVQFLSFDSYDLVKDKWEKMVGKDNLALEDEKKAIVAVVALSYHRLPDRLRDCFLYLGVFPAGYEIQSWTLTRLWIAEGFIQPEENRSLEKIAEDNLNDLISRNLLMVHKLNPMHEVKVCRVHDVIRTFCTDEAEKQSLFKEVRMPEENNVVLGSSDVEKIHRLCLHSDLDRFFSAKLKGPRVRSFLCFRKDAIGLEPENVPAIYENFLPLRILHFQSIKLKKIHPKLIKLIHLRYIVLCVPELAVLPEQISQLWNLQTIVVDTNSESLTMKANLWKMIRLRHVKTKAAIVLDKKNIKGEAGENLQTLNRLSPESVTATLSQKASNLKTLGVRGDLAPLFDTMSLEKMNRLEKLKLYQLTSDNRLKRFPDWNRFPPNLKRLTLSKTFLEWKHMSTLAMCSGLEVLKLKDNAFTGISWEAENHVFSKLRILLISYTGLVLWTALPATFPSLRHLELKNCQELKAIPDCVLQRLKNLDIGRVHKSIADSAKNMALDLKLGPDLM